MMKIFRFKYKSSWTRLANTLRPSGKSRLILKAFKIVSQRIRFGLLIMNIVLNFLELEVANQEQFFAYFSNLDLNNVSICTLCANKLCRMD